MIEAANQRARDVVPKTEVEFFLCMSFISSLSSFSLLEVFCVCVCVCVCVPKSLKVTMRALFLFPEFFIFKL